MTSDIDERISDHYGWSGLMEAIEQEIRRKGIDPEQVTVADLAPVDNYHWHRLAGTLALARAAEITAADRVLDVGGGIGGPARQLAHRFGCHVTVLDLTSEYCVVGQQLTAWTGLTDRVTFVHASALEMPFPDSSFDVAWTQHASMNIPDKAGLYRERSPGSYAREAGLRSSTCSRGPISRSTSQCHGPPIRPSISLCRRRRLER
jgi:SAM-dependent methyltransferase